MEHWNKICGIISIFLFSVLSTTAQSTKILSTCTSSSSAAKPFINNNLFLFPKNGIRSTVAKSIKLIDQAYYTQHFGFFCKKELALEKVAKIPLKIRLGSLQQCDYLEGKK